MSNFWNEIKKPIYALAPMEDVTDTVFREIVLSISQPEFLNVVFAEFISTDGLCHPVGKDKVSHRLFINESERKLLRENNIKIVAQIWGSDPEKFHEAAKIICSEYDFDGIDINMGCPVKKIIKQASCSELIKFPELAKEIVIATKEAANIPVSVKTRTGIKEHVTESWIADLIEVKPTAITLHCRTQKMMTDFPAEWDQVGIAVNVKNSIDPEVKILGNGDLFSLDDCSEKIEKYRIDGVMVGRGVFKNPWMFNSPQTVKSIDEKLRLLWHHVELFVDTWNNEKSFNILRRFFKIYTTDFYGAAEIRTKLYETKNKDEVRKIIEKHLE
jgi:nifR3 family TIM-barrel protein